MQKRDSLQIKKSKHRYILKRKFFRNFGTRILNQNFIRNPKSSSVSRFEQAFSVYKSIYIEKHAILATSSTTFFETFLKIKKDEKRQRNETKTRRSATKFPFSLVPAILNLVKNRRYRSKKCAKLMTGTVHIVLEKFT